MRYSTSFQPFYIGESSRIPDYSPNSRPKFSQIFRVGVGRTSYVMFEDVLTKFGAAFVTPWWHLLFNSAFFGGDVLVCQWGWEPHQQRETAGRNEEGNWGRWEVEKRFLIKWISRPKRKTTKSPYTSSSRASRGRKFQKKKELYI